MLSLLVGLAFASGALGGSAQEPPRFRAAAHAVVIDIPVFEGRKWCRGSKAVTNLTVADFTIALDKKPYDIVTVTQLLEKPGHYLVSFTVPDALREGKKHRIEIKIRKRGGLLWWDAFPNLPNEGGPVEPIEDWISEVCR